MATSANLPSGAIAANGGDPFTGSPTVPPPGPARFAPFDNDQFSAYSTSSPSQARRALEAHLKDTDRRIQDASKLGTTLLQQRKNLASRLQEVEELSKDHDVPAELQQRLTALEKEYNDIGRESARAFLPKSRPLPGDSTPSVYSSTSGRESPTKVSAPSRRQRNQPSNRVHDIEFATEISTQLLAQVRQLQTALAEKDEELKDAATSRTQLENDHLNIVQRAKLLDENLQRHRDENWNLETKIQDLETSMRESADREQRLQQTLKTTHTEKTTAERDLDELKALHEKATDEHATVQRHHEADLHTLRRDAANHESEKQTLHKKIEELTSQNTELAKAVSYRWNQGAQPTQAGAKASDESEGADEPELDHTDLISPVKGTPARGGLESETLKSSLNHAHRMIQNLKNNIHREKTEKVELKRMLADARDELEKRRDSNAGIGAANLNKKRADAAKARKPIRADRLGANRTSTTEIINDEGDWEESDDPTTPSKTSFGRPATGAAAMPGAFQETDTSDAFETADERRGDTATETEAFQTGAESFGDDSDLTETESISKRPSTSTSRKSATPSIPTRPGMPGDRHSYLSTASASGEEYEDEDVVRTPVQSQGPKYRLRVNRGLRTSSGPSLNDRLTQSPASSMGTPQPAGQSLGDELDALDDDDDSIEGTPNTRFSASPYTSPEMHRTRSVEPEIQASEDEPVASIESGDGADDTQRSIGSPFTSPVKSRKSPAQKEFLKPKPAMVDSGMMTEPWQPEKEIIVQRIPAEEATEDDNKAASAVAGAAGGALAGIGLGRLSKHDCNNDEQKAVEGNESSGDETPAGLLTPSRKKARKDQATSPEPAVPQVDPIVFQHSAVLTQETEPIAAPVEEKASAIPFQQSSIFAQETEPVSPPRPVVKAPVPFELAGAGNATRQSMVYSQETEPVSPPKPAVKAPPMLGLVGAGDPSGQSAIYSQETEPVTPPQPAAKAPPALALAGAGNASRQSLVYSQETEPVSPPSAAPVDAAVGTQSQPQEFGFSAVSQQDFEPQDVSRPLVPRRSSRRMDMLYTSESEKGGDAVRASAPPGLYGEDDPALAQRRELASRDAGADATPRAIPGHLTEHERALSSDSMIPITKPLSVKRPMAESGSQTEVSGDEIDRMMRDKTNVLAGAGAGALAGAGVVGAAAAAGNARRSVDSAMSSTFQPRPSTPNDNSTLHVPRQSSSTSNMRGSANMDAPPLPADHNKKIAAAAHKGPVMGPPAMPASAFKQPRPRTPVGAQGGAQIYRPMSKDSNTVRPAGRAGSGVSRQASVSSFASELDERFNIHSGRFPYPDDMPPTTDPRMIQAITQTMIGEFLWKYTRKAGRNEMSSTRHRRFFWVHPYTRTLYWSESDPTTAGKNMMKAKSMSIEAVRVITDDNTNPPGLHRKSIVVVTPGREIVFTAPTGQRHETWFNALSYLLLRTESERHEADDTINEEDLEDFNPEHDAHHPGGAFSFRRSVSRMTGRSQSRRSLSSYHSRSRPSSPTKTPLSQQHQPTTPRPPLNGTPTLTPTTHDNYASTRSRLSSFTGRLRNPSAQRGSFTSSSRPGAQSAMSARTDDPASTVEGSAIYNASVVSDSAEDLRAVIERQERDADRLENVRACCDGKHDVGSLSRRGGRHASFTSRAAVRGHSHGPPPAPTTGASGLGIAGQGGQSLRER